MNQRHFKREADLFIEAVAEDMEIRHKMFADIEAVAKESEIMKMIYLR